MIVSWVRIQSAPILPGELVVPNAQNGDRLEFLSRGVRAVNDSSVTEKPTCNAHDQNPYNRIVGWLPVSLRSFMGSGERDSEHAHLHAELRWAERLG